MAAESGLEAAAVNAGLAYVPVTSASADVTGGSSEADVDPPAEAQRLLDRLFAEPWSFEFFQAMHLLERLQPERTGVGGFGDPRGIDRDPGRRPPPRCSRRARRRPRSSSSSRAASRSRSGG